MTDILMLQDALSQQLKTVIALQDLSKAARAAIIKRDGPALEAISLQQEGLLVGFATLKSLRERYEQALGVVDWSAEGLEKVIDAANGTESLTIFHELMKNARNLHASVAVDKAFLQASMDRFETLLSGIEEATAVPSETYPVARSRVDMLPPGAQTGEISSTRAKKYEISSGIWLNREA
jgi:hypothetical protein